MSERVIVDIETGRAWAEPLSATEEAERAAQDTAYLAHVAAQAARPDPDADVLGGLAALKVQGAAATTVAALKANHLAALDLMERWVQARRGGTP